MLKPLYLTTLLSFLTLHTSAQTINTLRQQIQQIIASKKAVVCVSIISSDGKDKLSINGEKHCPMQSVFKFHIALAVLRQVDKGKLSLDQKLEIRKQDLLPGLYSPLRDKYPDGGSLPISEILAYTVSASDNVGCDVLLKLLGGPQAVETYFVENGFKDVSIKYNEEDQQGNWDLQFKNYTTPAAANKVLAAYYYNEKKLLSKESHAFIWKLMKETETGENRLKGELPVNIVVAHKTGTSGVNKEGTRAAVNDIGIIFLPNGQHFFISVFVTDSKENTETNEKIIADIAKAAWDHFMNKTK